jgi:GntR family galactonate operon transcriptional repressor
MAGTVKPGKIRAVVSELGAEITGGLLPPGSVLPPEHELEARFKASRGVVREAMKTLGAKGLVHVRPRHGTHVRPRHEWSWFDRDLIGWLSINGMERDVLLAFQETRLVIEPAAAALAARRATSGEKQAICDAYRAMTRGSADPALAIAADRLFHLAVLDATHNPVLQSLRGAIESILSAMFDVTVGVFEGNLQRHGAVADAIQQGDPRLARQSMEDLLGYTEAFLSTP